MKNILLSAAFFFATAAPLAAASGKNGISPAPAAPAKSVSQLSWPEYCRINDANNAALIEDIMTLQSPQDLNGNPVLELKAFSSSAKEIRARIVNVRHSHPGDQFHIEVYVAGKLLFKSGRQDNPIFIGFMVDDSYYSLACFEDIR